MADSNRYWGRYYKLTIRPPAGKARTFETKDGDPALDIKFDVTYATGQTAREGTVSILGLKLETIHEILKLSALPRGKAMAALATLTLRVGYKSGAGTVEVLNGFIWYGTVTSPPEMWLNLKVSEYNPLGGKAVEITCRKDTPLSEFLFYLCDQYSLAESDEEGGGEIEFAWKDLTQDYLVESDEITVNCQFTEKLSLQDCIRKISKELSTDVQFVLRTSSSESKEGYRVIEVLDKQEDCVMDGEVQVDADHGLLSVTGIDCVSGCITTFIDSSGDDYLCHLVLKSDLNPEANGTYYIKKKQYVGHYLGQEWYVKYYCSGKQNE